MGGCMVGVMDLDVVFEEWLRSRVSAERPGVAPGSVTEGGYDTDVEGMRAWRSDCSEFLVWLQANEPEMFGEFRYRYMDLDPEGWDALVGFAAGFHDKPAGPPDESQLESDLESLVDNPVVDGVPAVSAVLPPPPTTTTTVPPVSTTVPPRTIPITPDTGPEVIAPPAATTVPPESGGGSRGPGRRRPHRPVSPRPDLPITGLPVTTTTVPPVPVEEPEHPGRHANFGQGFERLIGSPSAELDHGYSIWPGKRGSNLRPTRDQWSQAGWDPVFNFVGSLVGGLFDLFGAAANDPLLTPGGWKDHMEHGPVWKSEDEKESLTEVYGTDSPQMRFAQLEGGWNER